MLKLHKLFYIIPVILAVVCISINIFRVGEPKFRFLIDYDSVIVQVEKVKNERGWLMLNDTISVWGGNQYLSDLDSLSDSEGATLSDFPPPYILIKDEKRHCYIVKGYDTLNFELVQGEEGEFNFMMIVDSLNLRCY